MTAFTLTGSAAPIVLDGGLATELEARGHDLSDDLWSARLLRDDPAEIEEVHLAFYRAGAQVAVTASYQASFEGFARAGISSDEAAGLIRRSTELAKRARARRLAELEGPAKRRLLVAASVGPYGAMLADGQEYEGNYGLTVEELQAFHRPRLDALVAGAPDLLAIETIPGVVEAEAVVSLLDELPAIPAWLSYTCADERHTCEGQTIEHGARVAARSSRVVAVGVNCTRPEHVDELLARARTATALPLVAYPNDGRIWDGLGRRWLGSGVIGFAPETIGRWHELGTRLIGGCCGVGPSAISALAASVERIDDSGQG